MPSSTPRRTGDAAGSRSTGGGARRRVSRSARPAPRSRVGQIHLGRPGRDTRLRTDVTALAVKLPDGRQVRLGNPGTSPVEARVEDGHWLVRGRSRHWNVQIEGVAPIASTFVLPIPLVEERRLAPGALEAQAGEMQVTVHHDGRLVWQGNSTLAALERGGRRQAEDELARRGGRPEPHPA